MRVSLVFFFFLFGMFYSALSSAVEPDINIETQLENSQFMVKQQLLYNATISYSGTLIAPTLHPPEIPNAIVLQAGSVKELYTKGNDVHPHSAKITWAIFPLKSGKMVIPPLQLKTSYKKNDLLDLNYLPEVRTYKQDNTTENTVIMTTKEKILTIATDDYSHLLNCKALLLSSQWNNNPDTLSLGQAAEYSVTIEARGLPSELIPAISIPDHKSYSAIEINSVRKNSSHAAGITGRYTVIFNITPKAVGNMLLPPFSIQWWNTEKQQLETVSLTGRQLTVKATTSLKKVKGEEHNKNPLVSTTLDIQGDLTQTHQAKPEYTNHPDISKTMILIFLGITALLLLTLSMARRPHKNSSEILLEKKSWQALLATLKQNNFKLIRQALRQWLHSDRIQKHLTSVSSAQIESLLFQIDRALYSREKITLNKAHIAKHLNVIRSQLLK